MSDTRTGHIAIDLGRRRVGIAVSGPGGVALPHGVIDGRDRHALIEQLARLARERDADFVVGLPRELDGRERRPAADARAFARTLERVSGRRVHLQDETLTTAEAQRLAQAAGRKPRDPIDDIAAQQILIEFLATQR
ncbi:MAG: Holliday junction resolvase RuvX [Deltaproteobacteria bacterium]|nr:Holliday junction resolvase RuvX [Deltaproteobacteria bacterium]